MKMIPKKEKQDHRNQIGSLLHFNKSSCIFSRSFKTEIRVKSFLLVTGSPSVIKALFFNQLLFKKDSILSTAFNQLLANSAGNLLLPNCKIPLSF